MLKKQYIYLLIALAIQPTAALAYVGPGAGITLLGALWGLIAGVVLAIGIILFWPLRLLLRKRKAKLEAAQLNSNRADTSPNQAAAGDNTNSNP